MSKDCLHNLLKKAPTSWAIIRAIECELLSKIDFKPPILDIGCGNGLFAQTLFTKKKLSIDVGVDINPGELKKAESTGIYKKLIQADAKALPFTDEKFATIFSNGVLEHIPNLNQVIREIARVLKAGGTFIATAPSKFFDEKLFYYQLFNSIYLIPLAKLYARIINLLFKHYNLLDHKEWKRLVSHNGMHLVKYQYYNPSSVIKLHDILLPLALLERIALFLPVRQHLIVPLLKPLLLKRLTTKLGREKTGGSILIIAKK